MKSLTVIYGNMGDDDCKQLATAWAGIDCAKVFEMNMESSLSHETIDNAISQEEDTLLFIGHGSPLGLFAVGGGGYALDGRNYKLIKAKRVICIWCFASCFCKQYNLKSLSSSMFISNPLEAHFCLNGGNGDCRSWGQDEINEVDCRFYSQLRDLMVSDKPMSQWLDELRGDIVDVSHPVYAIDAYNRNGVTLIE